MHTVEGGKHRSTWEREVDIKVFKQTSSAELEGKSRRSGHQETEARRKVKVKNYITKSGTGQVEQSKAWQQRQIDGTRLKERHDRP